MKVHVYLCIKERKEESTHGFIKRITERGGRESKRETQIEERERAFLVIKGGGGLGPGDNNNVKSEKPTKR